MTFVDILLTLLRGAGYTFLITVCCAATALVAGLGIAIARELGGAWLSAVLSAWVYVFRGVPMLVLAAPRRVPKLPTSRRRRDRQAPGTPRPRSRRRASTSRTPPEIRWM